MKKRIVFFFLLLLTFSCGVQKQIIDKPIVFNAEREELTRDYIQKQYGLDKETAEIIPKIIVLHWTVIPTTDGSFEAFKEAKLPNWRADIETISGLNVSSHFLVAQDGTIYRLMPETKMARHVIGLNYSAIGIENVGGTDDLPLTRAQIRANIWLVKYLKTKYAIDYLIGHYEYENFEGHELWLELNDDYRTKKTDPGIGFMKKVRKATKKLNFKPTPQKKLRNK